MSKPPKYALYDARWHGDPDRAAILDTSNSIKEMRDAKRTYPSSVIVEIKYDVEVR